MNFCWTKVCMHKTFCLFCCYFFFFFSKKSLQEGHQTERIQHKLGSTLILLVSRRYVYVCTLYKEMFTVVYTVCAVVRCCFSRFPWPQYTAVNLRDPAVKPSKRSEGVERLRCVQESCSSCVYPSLLRSVLSASTRISWTAQYPQWHEPPSTLSDINRPVPSLSWNAQYPQWREPPSTLSDTDRSVPSVTWTA